jgi:hypothetical protein
MPEDNQDQGIIPLSRFRAALARARRTRRADAMLSEPGAEQLVPQLPIQELYYAIKEVGLADAEDLVALASPDQIRGFVDLDTWERDHLDEARMREWIDTLINIGPSKLLAAVNAMDPEVIALFLQRQALVYEVNDEEFIPDEPQGRYYPTPDRSFMLDVLPEGEAGKTVERFVDWLYRADLEFARRVVMSAKYEVASDLEEWSYRWRSGRMSDLGYADFYEALSIYRYLDPGSVRLDEGSAGKTEAVATSLPMQLAGALDERGYFARALATIHNDVEIERLQGLLMSLVNKAMAADLLQPGDMDRAKTVLERAVGYLSVGLEYLSKGELERATVALRGVALERIFRVGASLTQQLKRLAEALAGKGPMLFDPPFDALLSSLREPRPGFPRSLDSPLETGTRAFRTLADIRTAAAALEEASRLGPFVFGGLGITREALAEALAGSTLLPTEVRFGTLVRTVAANVLLDRPTRLVPLHPRDLRALRLDDEGRQKVERALRALSDEHGGTPAELSRWLDRWLTDFNQPDKLLIRYSWLK